MPDTPGPIVAIAGDEARPNLGAKLLVAAAAAIAGVVGGAPGSLSRSVTQGVVEENRDFRAVAVIALTLPMRAESRR